MFHDGGIYFKKGVREGEQSESYLVSHMRLDHKTGDGIFQRHLPSRKLRISSQKFDILRSLTQYLIANRVYVTIYSI